MSLRMRRFVLRFDKLGITPRYVPGARNRVVDALSRVPGLAAQTKEVQEERKDVRLCELLLNEVYVQPDEEFLGKIRKGYEEE
uniref:Uncharacterized protein n=1 Tax=Chromera velia CCMP2878 TaxID=1169474 RepID=A0A0G4HUG4_9ALVE|eukprot:Cvel_31859.t1-p1 / transcript=Cvel_31859.t1 / gene=Cvel_31859 / organism=Chromera_velia_CCMP2878 / gene_product=hypothetical protein / transcript_product=hypothetical protein / location=Cvel_scaffold4826:2525-2770(-) / protein_length=82 / sequence_SO=supercontig / SO=protein_coding / is_pseudo=false